MERGSTKNSALKVYKEYTKAAQRVETKVGGERNKTLHLPLLRA